MKKAVLLLLVVVISILIYGAVQYEVLTLEKAKYWQQQYQSFVNENIIISSVLYFLIYCIVVALSIPGAAVITILAGALFGTLWGSILVSFASTVGACFAFLAARLFFADWVRAKFSTIAQKVNQQMDKSGGTYILTLRLIPTIPFFVVNLVLGLTNVHLKKFYIYSQIGMLPATVVYVNLGTQLQTITSLQSLLSPSVLGAFLALALLPLVIKYGAAKFLPNKEYK